MWPLRYCWFSIMGITRNNDMYEYFWLSKIRKFKIRLILDVHITLQQIATTSFYKHWIVMFCKLLCRTWSRIMISTDGTVLSVVIDIIRTLFSIIGKLPEYWYNIMYVVYTNMYIIRFSYLFKQLIL